jgi:glycosyltransferase involved in cell wall biosynthesis
VSAPGEGPASASGAQAAVPPMFSVVIPTHQSREFLLAALASVRAQTLADFEVVVVDNGSTDGSEAAVAALGDARIRCRWQEDSGLPADSRNRGVALARGEWIAFLDADDLWAPGKLARVAAAIAADPSVDALCHAVREIDAAGRVTGARAYALDARPVADQLQYRGNFLTTSAMVVRRAALEAAGGFDTRPEYFTVEDFDLWLRLAEAGRRFVLLADVLGDYRRHAGGASAKLARHYDHLVRVLDDHARRRAQAGVLDHSAALWRLARTRVAEAKQLARAGAAAEAARVLAALPGEWAAAQRSWREAARG